MKADIPSPDRPFVVLLYYKYTTVDNPEELRDSQRALLETLDMKGRILVGPEGINGTIAGLRDQADAYIAAMHADPRFADMLFKEEYAAFQPFRKVKVKVRPEIVAFGVEEARPEDTAPKLDPKEFHEMAQRDDVIILDARSNFESRIGKFKNAITPDVDYFRELPNWIDEHLDDLKDKTVLMYCNGNIRCERSSAYLKQKGAENVYSLREGIVNYTREIPDGLWEGSLFVFDERMQVQLNDDAHHEIISTCDHCDTKTDTYYNCCNAECNKFVLLCDTCRENSNQACSEECSTKHRDGVVKHWNITNRAAE